MKDILLETVRNIIMNVEPLIGKKNQKCIDDVAGGEICKMIKKFAENNFSLEILSVEGERDGIDVSHICEAAQKNANYYLLVDPIDGTLAASQGGSRCVSAIAIGRKNAQYLKLPDELSCFYVASNCEKDFVEKIFKCISKGNKFSLYKYEQDIIGTLRRKESEVFWKKLLQVDQMNVMNGEEFFNFPNGKYRNIFFAGDSSIPLFYECQHFCGRTGVVEARIESRLWKYWKGIIISGRKIKEYKGGIVSYLYDYLKAIRENKLNIEKFFFCNEIEKLYQVGWTKQMVMKIFEQDQFAPEMEMVIIGSLTGTIDKVFTEHSYNNLMPMKIDRGKKRAYINYLLYEKGRINLYDDLFSIDKT